MCHTDFRRTVLRTRRSSPRSTLYALRLVISGVSRAHRARPPQLKLPPSGPGVVSEQRFPSLALVLHRRAKRRLDRRQSLRRVQRARRPARQVVVFLRALETLQTLLQLVVKRTQRGLVFVAHAVFPVALRSGDGGRASACRRRARRGQFRGLVLAMRGRTRRRIGRRSRGTMSHLSQNARHCAWYAICLHASWWIRRWMSNPKVIRGSIMTSSGGADEETEGSSPNKSDRAPRTRTRAARATGTGTRRANPWVDGVAPRIRLTREATHADISTARGDSVSSRATRRVSTDVARNAIGRASET